MKENFTHIAVLLDKSGSMQKVQTDTIGGFNQFINEQRKVPGLATITLYQFSNKCEPTYIDVPLDHIAELTTDTYKCSGWTMLNDSLARLINDVGARLAIKPENERPSKIIILILTDGEENTSKEFVGAAGLAKLSGMVTHQKEKYSWEFVFVGANINAFATANTYGIDSGHAINYLHNKIGQQNVFKSIGRGFAASRISANTGLGMTVNFFENEDNLEIVSGSTLDVSDISTTIDKYIQKGIDSSHQDKDEKSNT